MSAPNRLLELIEIELTRIRRTAGRAAETADDAFLLYLLDMAILEVNRKASTCNNGAEKVGEPQVVREGDNLRRKATVELRVVS